MSISDWSSDVCSSDLEQTFLIELFMTFVINLIRINRMKTQKDTEILSKIINLMLNMAQRLSKPISWDLLETGHIANLRDLLNDANLPRSENSGVGKEGVSTCRSGRGQ